MSDINHAELADEILQLEAAGAAIAQRRTELLLRMRQATASAARAADDNDPERLDDLVGTGAVMHRLGIAKSVLLRRAEKHPLGTPGGFSMFKKGRWLFSLSRAQSHFQADPPRRKERSGPKNSR